MTGLSSFDTTIQKSNKIINEVGEEANIHDRHTAFQALRYTMQALRDRLPVNEAVHFGAQLPILLSGYYYEGWKPASVPHKDRSVEEFLNKIKKRIDDVDSNLDTEQVARSVFKVLSNYITEGEMLDIIKILPEELHELWPQEIKAKV